jgi:polyhydroxyalkanoate synthesis regulator phasin
MNLLPVEGKDDFARDLKSRAVINTDHSQFEAYMNTRNRLSSQKERVDKLEEKVDDLSDNINDIKSMLQTIIKQNGQ